MRFYQLWEEITATPGFNNDILQEIANSIFGQCGRRWPSSHGKVSCKFMNRDIGLYYDESQRTVEIEFFWERTPNLSDKNSEFNTASSLQPGTIDGMRKFGEFAKKLREYKVKITFFSLGKRVQLYDRVLRGAGYTRSDEKFATATGGDFVYVP